LGHITPKGLAEPTARWPETAERKIFILRYAQQLKRDLCLEDGVDASIIADLTFSTKVYSPVEACFSS
jgi:hypothetical protein